MWPWQRSRVSHAQTQAENAIADTLMGGDSLPAWNAVWDLVQSHDSQGKQEILNDLRDYVASSVTADGSPIGSSPRDRARDFEQAIDQSMSAVPRRSQVLPSREVRRQAKHDQIESNRQAMRDIGVRPGDGIPMWAMYMTRRSKRSWG